jgi:predicted amidohydrolase YtcJ
MHGGVLNSKALEWAGLDENSETPGGGVIARLPGSNERIVPVSVRDLI